MFEKVYYIVWGSLSYSHCRMHALNTYTTLYTDLQSQVEQLSANQVILTDKLLDSATAHASIEKDESASDFVRKLSSPSNSGLHRRTISSPISPSKESDGDTLNSVNKQRSWSASPKNKTRGLKSKTSDIDNQSTGFDNEYINSTSPDRIAKNSAKRYQPPRFNPLSIEQGDGTLEVKPNDHMDEECNNIMHQQQDHDDDNSSKHMKPGWSGGSQSSESSISNIFPPFKDQIKERGGWLIGLLFLQSMSSFIIQYNEQFLADNMVLVQFLTMLVGAGGNAGNQAAVRVIRCLAVGTLNKRTMKFFLLQGK